MGKLEVTKKIEELLKEERVEISSLKIKDEKNIRHVYIQEKGSPFTLHISGVIEEETNLCPECSVYCEKRFIDGRCE
jgi:inactivated superfamily I helicase